MTELVGPESGGTRPAGSCVVVAVVPATAEHVLREAVSVADAMGLDVVVAYVDPLRVVVQRYPDGTQLSTPLDPDADDNPRPSAEIRALTAAVRARRGGVRLVELAGGPAQEIARLAATVNARMIVVGTREPGLAHHGAEFFTGSVAAHLAHRQPRPVLVVPTWPGSFDRPAPWESPQQR